MTIHPTALIDPRAELGADVEIGPFCVVGPGVVIGASSELMAHATVMGPCVLGQGCRVFPNAVVGTEPQDTKYRGEPTRLVVGAGTVFREGATAHRGTAAGRGETRIGRGCLFLANSHVAHDCVVGNQVVFANSAAIAGHTEVGDHAILGAMVGLHQNARIGRLAMIGAGAMVSQDIPPFMLAQGDRARLVGLNVIGLRRASIEPSVIEAIRGAFRLLFASGQPLSDAIASLRCSASLLPELQELLLFVESSRRGVARLERAEESS